MSRHVTVLALFTAGLLESGCGFQHATPRGPLASVADSIAHAARRIDCETPDHRSFGDIDYRICSTETGNALYDVDREGRILSTAESWAADSASSSRTQGLIASLDQRAVRVTFAGDPEGQGRLRWQGDSVCHYLAVDPSAGDVIYVRTLRVLSSGCTPS